TGHRRTVSNSSLVFEGQYPGRSDELVGEVARLVRERGAAEEAGAQPAVDRDAIAVLGDEVLVAVFLHQLGDALDREVPRHPLEFVRARLAMHRILQTVDAVHVAERRRAARP